MELAEEMDMQWTAKSTVAGNLSPEAGRHMHKFFSGE